MNSFDEWLKQATRRLAPDAAVQVRIEIEQHYECARDAAMADGATAEEADRFAMNALGDASTANFEYRQVLLTNEEAKLLRQGSWEARAIGCRPWLRLLALGLLVTIVVTGAALSLTHHGHGTVARDAVLAALAMSPFVAALFLPIYTPQRSFVFRCVKWIVMTAAIVLLYGPNARQWSWLLISCLWPLAWTEWTRDSIRRKLPVKSWPRHLYL